MIRIGLKKGFMNRIGLKKGFMNRIGLKKGFMNRIGCQKRISIKDLIEEQDITEISTKMI